jgi:phage gp45-like
MLSKLVRWARVTKSGADDGQFATQTMEYLGKVADGLMVFPYGMHGNVPEDALALMFSIQGSPDNRAAIGWTPKDRPTLKGGEVALYHPPTDAFLIWRESGDLDIETGSGGTANVNINCKQANITASESVTVDSPLAVFTGNVEIDQNLTVTGDSILSSTVTSNGKDISDTHNHGGSPTAPAGPVSNTGVPT